MEYKQVKFIMDENKQLKAEIERLKAEQQQILGIAIGFHDSYKDLRATRDMAKIVGVIHGDTDEQAWQRADIAEWKAYSQQQPEPPQESLEIRILRYLAKCTVPKSYAEISEELGLASFLSGVMSLVKSDYLLRRSSGFQITAAGRDYLASLEPKEPEGYMRPCDACSGSGVRPSPLGAITCYDCNGSGIYEPV